MKTKIISLALFATVFGGAVCNGGQKIDAHIHVASNANFGGSFIDGDQIVKLLDTGSIDRGVILSFGYRFSELEQAKAENDFVAAEVAKRPARLTGLCGVNILEDWAPGEIERCATQLRLSGLKLHPQENGADFKNPEHRKRLAVIFDAADKYHLPVLIDSFWMNPNVTSKVVSLTAKHPNINFIFAHALAFNFRELALVWTRWANNPKLPHNIYVDLSMISVQLKGSPEVETLRWELSKLGWDRVLYGTDYPMFDENATIAAVKALVPAKELNKVMGENAARLYGL